MKDILRIAAPFTVWIAAFSLIYGLEGIVCSRHGDSLVRGQGRILLIAAALAVIVAQLGLLRALSSPRYRASSGFARRVSLTLAIAALITSVWTLLPVATLPLCEAM